MGRLKALPARLAALPSRIAGFDAGERGRAQASPWRAWYKTARWMKLRLVIFRRDRFTCQWPGCGRIEGDTSRLVADHRNPHRGDEGCFWDSDNLQTLCKPCHDGRKKRAERGL